MDINDPRSPHLVRTRADHCRRPPSSTGTASCVFPLVLRGRCSALQDPRHLVSVAGCGSLSVAPHHATTILAHASIEQKYIENVKPADTPVGGVVKNSGTCAKPLPSVISAHRILSIPSARQRTAVQSEMVACVIQEVWKQKTVSVRARRLLLFKTQSVQGRVKVSLKRTSIHPCTLRTWSVLSQMCLKLLCFVLFFSRFCCKKKESVSYKRF